MSVNTVYYYGCIRSITTRILTIINPYAITTTICSIIYHPHTYMCKYIHSVYTAYHAEINPLFTAKERR